MALFARKFFSYILNPLIIFNIAYYYFTAIEMISKYFFSTSQTLLFLLILRIITIFYKIYVIVLYNLVLHTMPEIFIASIVGTLSEAALPKVSVKKFKI